MKIPLPSADGWRRPENGRKGDLKGFPAVLTVEWDRRKYAASVLWGRRKRLS